MGFAPTSIPPGSAPYLIQDSEIRNWTPLFRQDCTFSPEIFGVVMRNLVQNPNLNSTYLFRADIITELPSGVDTKSESRAKSLRIVEFKNFDLKNVVVRTLIPRNVHVSKPLDQTCLFYESRDDSSKITSMVVYLPHISSESESPFYHPAVYGISFLHEFYQATQIGVVSIHYCFFESEPRSVKLERTAYHLLAKLYKHGIAAFLIELWNEIYKDKKFPGFVDIGCGNGLLVHILREEGYTGWGFDARYRKSWSTYSKSDQENLKEMVLIPFLIESTATPVSKAKDTVKIEASSSNYPCSLECIEDSKISELSSLEQINRDNSKLKFHSGIFSTNTFIISNHSDELTPWTPLLAAASRSSFLIIPCCSHDLNGARKRAPDVEKRVNNCSSYASLVAWVCQIAMDCGWEAEKEMLRIPSTRNTAIIGRNRTQSYEDVDLKIILEKHGGANDWVKNTLKLLSKSSSRIH
ncbi:hypothetical protein EPUL_006284 [Erysiphe pulchra]|uniref:tRNA (uracil-O(2)-)-methyltransferase n=1 Tax=Erysiphe pulchra TaxID=225359 RepID=A0A2S4PJU0_9PEZI|nr:hypothetical protein EPUL_006284 [Erysiphe pulchra]